MLCLFHRLREFIMRIYDYINHFNTKDNLYLRRPPPIITDKNFLRKCE